MDEPTGNNMEKIFLDEMYGDLTLKNCGAFLFSAIVPLIHTKYTLYGYMTILLKCQG